MDERRVRTDVHERASAIAALSLQLAAEQTAGALEQEVVRQVSRLVGDAAALWRRDDEGHLELVAATHAREEPRSYIAREAPFATHSDTTGVLPVVWRSGQPVRLGPEQLAEWLPVFQPSYQAYAERYGMASLLIVPLKVRGQVVAMLGVARDAPPELDDDDQAFVEQIGAVIAVALHDERMLRLARGYLAEQNRATVAAHRAALHDALTGLPNRRLLLERLSALGSRDDRDLALLLVDVDDFKHINDAHGHDAGDAALVAVAARLEDALARHPLAARSTLARLGGDEFAVLLSLPPGSPPPQDLASALVTSLAAPLPGLPDVRVGASVGLAAGPARSGSTLLRHADIAMYRAKRTRSGWAQWSAEHDRAAEGRLGELAALDAALDRGLRPAQLVVDLQPLVRRRGTGPQLVEGLVRWHHPERGRLLPEAFLPLAQESGRLARLTDVVLAGALDHVAAWRDQGRTVQVSVNVGGEALGSPGFLPHVREELQARGLGPEALCLELVESELLSPDGPARLAALRDAGLTVALDDFGTGWSSLAHLADLPLDLLKLDRSFVHRMSAGPREERFVAGVVGLVHDLGLPVVAEGVEDAQEASRLDELGVELQQGFWHCAPAGRAAVERHWDGVAP